MLFDGHIPNIIREPVGNTWARQLLAMQGNGYSAEFLFDFVHTPGYSGVEMFEIVLFNCPQWSISAYSVRVENKNYDIRVKPCDSLVKICIPHSISSVSSLYIAPALVMILGYTLLR